MRAMLRRAREATAALWPDVRAAFAWVQEAAEVLEHRANETGEAVRRHYEALLERMRAQAAAAGALHGAIENFVKVTREAIGRDCSTAMTWRGCPARTTTLSSSSAQYAIGSDDAPGANGPHPPWWCVGPCG
jgi:hypothetical protein